MQIDDENLEDDEYELEEGENESENSEEGIYEDEYDDVFKKNTNDNDEVMYIRLAYVFSHMSTFENKIILYD